MSAGCRVVLFKIDMSDKEVVSAVKKWIAVGGHKGELGNPDISGLSGSTGIKRAKQIMDDKVACKFTDLALSDDGTLTATAIGDGPNGLAFETKVKDCVGANPHTQFSSRSLVIDNGRSSTMIELITFDFHPEGIERLPVGVFEHKYSPKLPDHHVTIGDIDPEAPNELFAYQKWRDSDELRQGACYKNYDDFLRRSDSKVMCDMERLGVKFSDVYMLPAGEIKAKVTAVGPMKKDVLAAFKDNGCNTLQRANFLLNLRGEDLAVYFICSPGVTSTEF